MWRAKVFSRLERTHILGRKNPKSRGVAMTSDFGALVFVRNSGRDRDARSARSYTCILSQKPRPAQRVRNREKAPTETAAVVTHCVFLLPLGGSSRRDKQGEGYRSALGLHPMVRYSIAIILYDSRSSITLERLEQKRAGKASMKSRITRSGAALIA